ncbi:MAG: type IV pilus twitching motility protein PilT [Planctomycetes bacterium]|nr:type IV pilus twitching motility protein PilT [Planctomycetota bacterium]
MTREIAALETSTAEESDAGFAQELAAASGLVGAPLAAYLKFARDMGASDLHLQAGEPPFVRAHGFIHYMEHPTLSPKAVQGFIGELLTAEERTEFVRTNDMDLCYEAGLLGRFRVNCFRQRKGLGAVFRLIPSEVPTLEELGLPAVLKRFTTFHQGIVLITGPSGCGKSSTMAALIEIINRERKDHVITVEDPIEFRFASKKANISQRQVHVHTRSWEISLRAALREDPDVIMIGEMRDLDTISTAVTAAETGHLVLGTLHTSSATRSIDRILDVFPPKEQGQVRAMVSESLRGVISQVLIPVQDGKGRVPAVEIMFNTPAIANLIRDQKTFQIFNQMQTGRTKGMQLMDDAIKQLVKDGKVKKDMAVLFSNDPKQFMEV